MTYAKGTDVSVNKSQEEITRVFQRYGVETYGFMARPGSAAVQFETRGVPVDLVIPLPARPTEEKFYNQKTGRWNLAMPVWEQEVKEAWRALLLLIKANLEAVDRGLLTAEQAFMAYIAIPGQGTLGDLVLPQWREKRLELTS